MDIDANIYIDMLKAALNNAIQDKIVIEAKYLTALNVMKNLQEQLNKAQGDGANQEKD